MHKHPGHRMRRHGSRRRFLLLLFTVRCGECGYRRSRCRCGIGEG